ncbi:MAG: glucan biosynthesis protein [Pseudobdellovibrionaceae bacterium]
MKRNWIFLALLSLSACSNIIEQAPLSEGNSIYLPQSSFKNNEMMDLERLKSEAFSLCQSTFKAPVIEPLALLDPPLDGNLDSEGMVYQEELSIKTTNLLNKDQFYFSPRPRAALNRLPMEIFIDSENSGIYQRKTWEDANPDYSSPQIQPPILKDDIPPAGRALTELIIGHRSPQGDYPQLFDIRSNAYIRFAGYPPQVTGASLRLGAHHIFNLGGQSGLKEKEDFPLIRAVFASVKNPKITNALVLVESELFCGALNIDMAEAPRAELVVDGYWYTRDNFNWKQDPNTGFVAYSSMMWKSEKQTPEIISDEAHDSDVLLVKPARGPMTEYLLDPPSSGLRVREITTNSGKEPVEWILANQDLDPSHYSDFYPALGKTNYNFRASYKVSILESNIKTGVRLYEQATGGEYNDNIVVASTIHQDVKKANSVDDYIHFKYKTSAFMPANR